MDKISIFIDWLVTFTGSNPPIVLIVFFLSLIANLIQIGTYFRDKRLLKKQAEDQQRLTSLVETYEDVLKLAKETVEDKEEIESLKCQIAEKIEFATNLTEGIKVLEKVAQRRLVEQAIDYNLSTLRKAYDEILRLRAEYKDVGDLPDVPLERKAMIEAQVGIAVNRPYELPPEFLFRSILLVLFFFLVPYPVDSLLQPFLLTLLMKTLFDATELIPNERFKLMVRKYYSIILLLAALSVWRSFFGAIDSVGYYFAHAFWSSISELYDLIMWPISLIFGVVDWRKLRVIAQDYWLPNIPVSEGPQRE